MRAHKDEMWKALMPPLQSVNNRLLDGFAQLEAPLKKFLETSTAEMTLRIGLMTFTVESRTPSMTRVLYQRFSKFLGNPEQSCLRVVCESKAPADSGWMNGMEKNSTERRSNYWVLRTPHFEASYFPRYHMAWAAVPENTHQLLRLFRMLFTVWMQERGGALVQAMTVTHQNRSFVFVDCLSAGYDSLALTCRPDFLMGDEYSLLIPLPSTGFGAFAAPFGEEPPQEKIDSTDASLAGIYFLDEDAQTPVTRLTPQEAFPRLMRHVLSFSRDPQSVDQVRSNVLRLLDSTPLFKVSSNSDQRLDGPLSSFYEVAQGH